MCASLSGISWDFPGLSVAVLDITRIHGVFTDIDVTPVGIVSGTETQKSVEVAIELSGRICDL
jgi:hypothetical protein